MTNNIHNLDFGALEKPENGGGPSVPASVTLLVSLFLILITFFVIINQSATRDTSRKSVAYRSVQNKFGAPVKDSIDFGQIIKPKYDNYALEMEKLFGANAVIKTTVNGDETTINAQKNFFYYSDEIKFRPEKMEMLVKLQDILTRWDKSAKLKITFLLGFSSYRLDKPRLENFRQIMGRPDMDVGLNPSEPDKFSIIIHYE